MNFKHNSVRREELRKTINDKTKRTALMWSTSSICSSFLRQEIVSKRIKRTLRLTSNVRFQQVLSHWMLWHKYRILSRHSQNMDMKWTHRQTITYNFHYKTLFQNLSSFHMGSFFSLFISSIHVKNSSEVLLYLNGRLHCHRIKVAHKNCIN